VPDGQEKPSDLYFEGPTVANLGARIEASRLRLGFPSSEKIDRGFGAVKWREVRKFGSREQVRG
jgi:hypothetical protein